MSVLALAAPIAERNLGLAPRRELLAAGATGDAIDSAVRRGVLGVAERAVYRVPGTPQTPEQRLLATALAAHPAARYSHRSAAWFWEGLDAAPRCHELSVPAGVRFRRPRLIVHESSDLDRDVPGRVRGVPVTGVGRTVLDCARHRDIDLELLVDNLRRSNQVSRTLLPWTMAQHARRGRPGVQRLREHLVGDPLPASDFERLVARWLRSHGIGGWVLHHRVVVWGQPIEIDFAWPELKVALELDGADHWERIAVYERDAPRRNRLGIDGWIVMRCTWRRWINDPEGILAELVGALVGRRHGVGT